MAPLRASDLQWPWR